MKTVALALAVIGCLALCNSAEAGIFGRRVVVRSRPVVAVRAPVVVRQRAAIVAPRVHVAPAIVAPAVVVPAHPQILIAP